ncbi:hypothetical protein QO009_003182 [Brevibacillus aydinogluensis]|uniref:Uncharacterized protein n=1 Tax=Brevibacillus aydinogluensis TaxID=927786 RepID=A0AA48RG45_9BACL|nr:hypothetical protein [Brevibacillus aydinogluensis]CAJ1004423.1 hypothetical protein BSPP4475_19195 [Brevibacillus aydinogluensis]
MLLNGEKTETRQQHRLKVQTATAPQMTMIPPPLQVHIHPHLCYHKESLYEKLLLHGFSKKQVLLSGSLSCCFRMKINTGYCSYNTCDK